MVGGDTDTQFEDWDLNAFLFVARDVDNGNVEHEVVVPTAGDLEREDGTFNNTNLGSNIRFYEHVFNLRDGNAIDMGDAGFETYRIQIEDEHGDVVKYLAGTLDAGNIYDGSKMFFRKNRDAANTQLSSLRKSSRLISTSPNSFAGSNVITLTIDRNGNPGDPGFFEPMLDVNSDNFVDSGEVDNLWDDTLGWSIMKGLIFPKPSAYHAFPPDTFDVDNEDGNQISPTTSLKINSTMGLGDLVPPDILSDTTLDLESVWQITLLDED